ncbi:MAG: hypothetical protein NZ899_03745 [Thermoguttaceae bacterium]|nr:hypothetical protein [Thermoguttaceae bacterium]MDW8078769.1 hypothetical protein [Thermoguttaceae bacterium]
MAERPWRWITRCGCWYYSFTFLSVLLIGTLGCKKPALQTKMEPAVAPQGAKAQGPPSGAAELGESAATPGGKSEGQVGPTKSAAEAAAQILPGPSLKKPELLLALPEAFCNTPDAMCLLPDGHVLLSVPNFNNPAQPPVIMKIFPDNRAEVFLQLPDNPSTGKPFGPMGICVAPNGDLFLADNQREHPRKSRVCRIRMKNGLPVEIGPAVEGFNIANAVLCHNGYLYVTDTQIDANRYPALSGVFRFPLAQLDEAVTVLAEELLHDPHLVAVIETFDKTMPLGADGLCVDEDGNLYVGNVYDGTVHRIRFDAEGKVIANEVFAKSENMKSADGLFYDAKRKVIYVADPRANAVHCVHLDGRVETLAQNGDTDGRDGSLDMPVEVLVRGNELIISNMDWPMTGCLNSTFDLPATLSVIRLD